MVYNWITSFRNTLYNKQVLKSTSFKVPVISIGNLAVGGTGKTPHVEYLIRLLKNKNIATLSRGYKRKTKGFILADNTSNASVLGDEPFQYFADFKEITVAVCESRVTGIEKILENRPTTDVIILDDAFQHRAVYPTLNILITDFNRLFYKDKVLPFGKLRESKYGAERADIIIVSKSDKFLPDQLKHEITGRILKYSNIQTPVFFTTYRYGEPVAFGQHTTLKKQIVLVTGIANPKPLRAHLMEDGYQVLKHYNYPDHHPFKESELNEWLKYITDKGGDISIITTRKDATRMQVPEFREILDQMPVFYIPIQVEFLEKKDEFDKIVLKTVNQQN